MNLELVSRYGKPQKTDPGPVLELLGISSAGPAGNVFAFTYSSKEAAEAFAKSNLENHGHTSLGIIYSERLASWAGVLVLNPDWPRQQAS